MAGPHGFDADAMFTALDAQCIERELSWSAVARQMWAQSEDLNRARGSDHPLSPSTITGIQKRHDTTCQHGVIMLRWLGRTPEDFIAEPRPGTSGHPIEELGPHYRPRWNLVELYDALNARRQERGDTWQQAASRLHCTSNQLTGLRTARYATGMRLAMRICQALGRPAADFVHPEQW